MHVTESEEKAFEIVFKRMLEQYGYSFTKFRERSSVEGILGLPLPQDEDIVLSFNAYIE